MQIENGTYVVEVDGERHVAEFLDDFWMQIGVEYDVWQYTERGQLPVKVIARIDLNTLTIENL